MHIHKYTLLGALLVALVPSLAFAASVNSLGAATRSVYAIPSGSTQSPKNIERVRIPINLKTWQTVEARDARGKVTKSKILGQPISQVLRARIERSNDFYLGDWRVKTTPLRWLKNSNQYQVRLEVYQRLGQSGDVEESIGSVILTGTLSKQQDGLHILTGTARKVFRDKSGQPILDLEAGLNSTVPKATAVSRL